MSNYKSGTRGAFGNSRGGQNGAPRTNREPRPAPEPIRPEPLPEDYVDEAERVILCFKQPNERGKLPRCITTSKLRNLMSLASEIYNRENLRTEPTLLPESVAGINRMRMRAAYECGRDEGTKAFVQRAKLLEYLKWLSRNNDRAAFISFAHYMEALVAYHRYYGLKED